MKTPIVTAIGCAAMGLSVLAATPAQASHYSLDAMSAHMMSAAQARTLGVAGQELHAFTSEADARKAMKAIRRAATKCSGTFTVKDDQGWTVTQKATNGQGETAEGDGFVWVKQVATAADAQTGIAESEYNTFRRVREFIQVISIEAAGPTATKVTSSQIKTADHLTGTLGAYWAW